MGYDKRCTTEADYEGIIKLRWCERCFGWHSKRSWEQSSVGSSVKFWLGSGDHLWIPADDLGDRALYKFASGCAMTTRILQTAEDAGQEMLRLE